MKYKLLLVLLCLFMLSGCSDLTDPTTHTAPVINVNPSDLTEQQLFTMLFDIQNKITLKLEMSDAELEKMQSDYQRYDQAGSKSPIYRMGNLFINITTSKGESYDFYLEEVGVRMKGNTSRTDFYSAQEGIYNIIHLKLSFQETFDNENYYGSKSKTWEENARNARLTRTFATLEKMDLRWNRCDDGTYLKEYFAYETYRQNGVLAPHTNLASFDWAGIHMGVFTINEPVDQIFLEKYLPEAALGGDLYKCGWAGYDNASFTNTKSIGIENEETGQFYAYDLKSNKKTSANEALIHMIHTLNDDHLKKESIAELVDMDAFLSFSAVSYLLGNPDDMRSNYNNYYLYFRADTGKAIFIPYDYDRCLGITTHWNPTADGVTSDSPFSSELNSGNGTQENPLILYTIASGGYYVSEYAQRLSEIAASDWFNYETFAQIYQTAKTNYDDLTKPGKTFHNANGLYLSFDIDRTSDFSSNGNISILLYLQAKQNTLQYYLAELDHIPQNKPIVPIIWYIRADATNWQNHADYAMTEENGTVCIRFTVTKEIRLKVYNDQTGRWYGSECIDSTCGVNFSTDHHTNIVLPAGTYTLTFDTVSEVIYLTKH